MQKAFPVLNAFLDGELQRLALPPQALALVGFSQGTMMALHTGLRRAAPAAIVGYSGMLVAPEGQAPAAMKAEVTARPPVFLAHGDQDQVIPPEALMVSAQGLAALDVPVEFHLSQGLGHGIDGDGLGLGAEFLVRHLVRDPARA